jgi:hypothetical protein
MVEAEEGNSWIYKNKDHGPLPGVALLYHINGPFRDDERCCVSRFKFAVGYGRWFEPCRQVHIFSRGAHQGHQLSTDQSSY